MERPASAVAGGLERLAGPLRCAVQEVGATAGFIFLLPPGERVVRLAMVTGASWRIAAPWARVATDASTPLTDAMRERRLEWVAGQEEMASRYPKMGLALPYDFMLAAAPFTSGTSVWGGVVFLWPMGHPPQLRRRERDAIDAFCRGTGLLLQQASDQGNPLLPASEPHILPPARSRTAGSAEGLEAVEFLERLPVGCWGLDLDGRITFSNAAAADLVGAGVADLMGTRPWETLPWLQGSAFEERYRAAVLSRRPTSFTALCPPDQWLTFHLYPGASGISVHITARPAGQETPPTDGRSPAEPGDSTGHHSLMHLAATLTEAVGVNDVAALVAHQLVPAFGPQGLALMVHDEGRLRIVGQSGYSSEFLDRYDGSPLTADTPPTHALTTGIPSFFTSFEDFKRAYPAVVRYGTRNAWAFLPLIASGRPVGALVLSYDQPRPFPPAERATLISLAGLIAQALDRARLYDAKHQLAHTLQTALLPKALPGIPGLDVAARYLPAGQGMDIGGDFYDLIPCDADTATAVIGDVQGHNVTAAALMGQIRTAVHAYATLGTPPGEVLARTNRLMADLDPGLFTSCLIARLDPSRQRACLATAGHPPPLLRHPDGRTEILRLPPGLLLGIDPHVAYPATDIPLRPGTVLALYTDGLVEAPGIDIDTTTAALAQQLAHAEDLAMDDLADTLVHYSGRPTPCNDDIALLLIRATPGQADATGSRQ
ncbi:SpoIIE family protein phosphatase [Streptomyces formicae]|uniref:SpoIIE family protein phosphatase n=1 Tax=Streptomyces formicae TaxID=1616117 RepID=A0ABY3WLN1_9ACTN|nr:SpoIIE family protein phosphatase [Streptomyces formicae]UNM13519.1 SpoIIE family protein phosphatase [Streptomyces formicae]